MKKIKGSRSGPNQIICPDCGGDLVFDYLTQEWLHFHTRLAHCINKGASEPTADEPNSGQTEADNEALRQERERG